MRRLTGRQNVGDGTIGDIRRIQLRGNDGENSSPDTEGMPAKWRRSQDHHAAYSRLTEWELLDELDQVEERWKKWKRSRLVESGLALFDLVARPRGQLFGESIAVFSMRGGGELPWHKFSHGDIVIISRSRPWDEKVVEGVVLDRSRSRIRVVCGELPDGLRKGSWRLDRGANRVAHDRMQEALESFHATEGDGGTVLSQVLLANMHDLNSSAAMVPEIGPMKRKLRGSNLAGLPLNESQTNAISEAVTRRLSLIQGPPGTGKTHTAVHLIKVWSEQDTGPILACADSNVAVDNLVGGLIDVGVDVVRIGRPVKVRAELRSSTLDARIEEHPDRAEVKMMVDDMMALKAELKDLKGKERGLAHRDISRGWKEIRQLEQRIIDDILDRVEVVCTTCIGAGHPILGQRRFTHVLIDEATQATEPTALVPIVRGARQLVLVGDHRQLPATVVSMRAENGGLARSLFERLINAGITPFLLEVQYRMHPCLRDFPSGRFYDGRLSDGINAEDRIPPAGFMWPDWDNPVAFIPIDGSEQVDSEGQSKSNLDEAGRVVTVVQSLLAMGDLSTRDIGVITPYNGQVRVLSDLFEQAGGRGDGEPYSGLEIKSVDGYQGREKEVIVFSTVRANENGEVGFLSDRRRLNVAITRARRGLIILGNMNTLRHDPTWASYLDWAQERKLIAWHAVQG